MPAGLAWFAEHQPFTPIIETVRGLLTGTAIGSSGLRGDGVVRRDRTGRLPLGAPELRAPSGPLTRPRGGNVGGNSIADNREHRPLPLPREAAHAHAAVVPPRPLRRAGPAPPSPGPPPARRGGDRRGRARAGRRHGRRLAARGPVRAARSSTGARPRCCWPSRTCTSTTRRPAPSRSSSTGRWTPATCRRSSAASGSSFLATGTADAYVDFAALDDGAVTLSADGTTATIALPAPRAGRGPDRPGGEPRPRPRPRAGRADRRRRSATTRSTTARSTRWPRTGWPRRPPRATSASAPRPTPAPC